MSKRQERTIEINDKYRVTHDRYQFILEKSRKVKNKDEVSWYVVGYFPRLAMMARFLADNTIMDEFGNISKMISEQKKIFKKIEEFQDMIIKDSTPTLFQERVIHTYHIEVLKEDKRATGGLSHVENKVKNEVVSDDRKKKSAKKMKKKIESLNEIF